MQSEDKMITIMDDKTGEIKSFIWDKKKEKMFMKKYPGLNFTKVAYIYFDTNKVVLFDRKHDDKEDRFQTIGKMAGGNLKHDDANTGLQGRKNEYEMLFAISTNPYVDVTKPIRILSARPAGAKEKNIYRIRNNLREGIRDVPKKQDSENIKKDERRKNYNDNNEKGKGKKGYNGNKGKGRKW